MTSTCPSYRKPALALLTLFFVSGCTLAEAPTELAPPAGATAIASPVPPSREAPETLSSAPTADLSRFAFPARVDPTTHYLFYLHGRIIEDQGLSAVSPEYGQYMYAEILGVLESHGFVVISEERKSGTDASAYVERVAAQVEDLLSLGVPPGSITVVGASKGAAITVEVSHLLANSEVNYVLLALN